jgi:hypothetical protein
MPANNKPSFSSVFIAKNTTPATATPRVQSDIYRWIAGKSAPDLYGASPPKIRGQRQSNRLVYYHR